MVVENVDTTQETPMDVSETVCPSLDSMKKMLCLPDEEISLLTVISQESDYDSYESDDDSDYCTESSLSDSESESSLSDSQASSTCSDTCYSDYSCVSEDDGIIFCDLVLENYEDDKGNLYVSVPCEECALDRDKHSMEEAMDCGIDSLNPDSYL